MRRLLLPVVLALVVAPAGLAAKFNFSVSTSSPVTAPTITLNGDDQTQAVTIVSRVQYTGPPRSGWKVQASATTLTSGSKTLPAMTVTAGSFSCSAACLSNPVPTGISYPITLSSTAQTIYNAGSGTGEGTFDVTSTVQITYPASALPGAYAATLTLTGSTGP